MNFGPVSGFSYTATAPTNGVYGIEQGTANGALSTNNPNESLILTFTGSPVTAIGGIFFPTDNAGRPANGTVTVTLSDGSTSTIVNDASAFQGFISASPIASLQVFTSGGGVWPSVDHLYVGAAAVPEPASIVVWSLLTLAVAGAGWWQQTKQTKTAS